MQVLKYQDYSHLDVKSYFLLTLIICILLTSIIVDKAIAPYFSMEIQDKVFFVLLLSTLLIKLIDLSHILPWMTLNEKQAESIREWQKKHACFSELKKLSVVRVVHYYQTKNHLRKISIKKG